jgi:membrane-associated phospholipid phosphatase
MMKEWLYCFKRIRKYDVLTIDYIFIWIFLIILYFNVIPYAGPILGFHIAALFISISLPILSPDFFLLKFLRNWYPFFFLPLFFTALHYLIPAINPRSVDTVLIKMDLILTGTYPTIWVERFYAPLVTEILQLSYLTFYFLPLLVLIPLYAKKDKTEYNRFVTVILLGFYLSYFGYLLFPALGPRYFLAHMHQTSLIGKGIYHSISSTLNGLENIQWDAFPSGHVTVALLFSHYAFIYYKKIFFWTIPVVTLLILSTIYLRYHYFVDLLAALILYWIIILVDRKLYKPRIDSS